MYGFWESNWGLLQQLLLTTELLFLHPLVRNFYNIHFWYSPLFSLLFSLNPCSVSRTKLSINLPPSDHHSMAQSPVHLHVTWLRGLILQSDSCPYLHHSKPSLGHFYSHCSKNNFVSFMLMPLPLSGPSSYLNPQYFTSIDFSLFIHIFFLALLSVLLTCKLYSFALATQAQFYISGLSCVLDKNSDIGYIPSIHLCSLKQGIIKVPKQPMNLWSYYLNLLSIWNYSP